MISVEPFQDSHMARLRPRECHQGEITPKKGIITLFHGDEPIIILGGTMAMEGVMSCWALVSDSVKNCPIAVHKTMIRIIRRAEEEYQLRRLQICVKTNYEQGLKWAKALGFELEGTMKKLGQDGTDYWLLARVKP